MSTVELLKLGAMLIAALSTLIGLIILVWKAPRWFQKIEDQFKLIDAKFETMNTSLKNGTDHFGRIDNDVRALGSEVSKIKGYMEALSNFVKKQ